MHRLDLRLSKAVQVLRRYVRGSCGRRASYRIVELETTALIELGEGWARAWLESEVARQEAEARTHVNAMGWTVPSKVAVQNVSPYKRAKSWEELGKLAPHIAAGRGQADARKAAIARLRAFRADYRDALARWVAGDRDVVFLASYCMRVHHGAKVAPSGSEGGAVACTAREPASFRAAVRPSRGIACNGPLSMHCRRGRSP